MHHNLDFHLKCQIKKAGFGLIMPTTETHPPDDKNPNLDSSIAYNGIISLVLSLIFLGVFVAFRRRARWVYVPNASLIPNHPILNPPSRSQISPNYDPMAGTAVGTAHDTPANGIAPGIIDHAWMDQYFGANKDPARPSSLLGWIWYVIYVPDTTLLTLVGMDAFVLLMSLKFFFICFSWLSVVGFLILLPVYCIGSSPASQLYLEFSIRHLANGSHWFWVPLILTYAISLYLFYAMFVFFNSYMHLRQAYLAHPACLTSLYEIIRFYEATGAIDTAYAMINLPSKTVMLEGLDKRKFLTEEHVVQFVEQTGVGKVKEAVLIRDHREIRLAIRRRNKILRRLEKAIMNLVRNVLVTMEKNQKHPDANSHDALPMCLKQVNLDVVLERPLCDDAGYDAFQESNSLSPLHQDKVIAPDSDYVFSAAEKASLLQYALEDSFLAEYRPRHKIHTNATSGFFSKMFGPMITVDSISYYYKILQYLDITIEKQRLEFMQEGLKNQEENLHQRLNVKNNARIVQVEVSNGVHSKSNNSGSTLEGLKPSMEETLFNDNSTFLNFMVTAKGLPEDFKLAFPKACKSAFVTFEESVSASVTQQSLLDPALFSFQVSPAPQSNEIHWENLVQSLASSRFKYWAVWILFVILNLLYSFPVTFIFSLNNITTLVKVFPFLEFIKKWPKSIQSIVEGSVSPLLLNLLLVLIPYALEGLTRLQGFKSETQVQSSLLTKYVSFLFLQTFLVTFFSGTLLDWLKPIADGEEVGDFLNHLLESIQHTLANRSSFYFNLMVLRIATNLFLQLADPAGIFWYLFLRGTLQITNETPREKKELNTFRNINYGWIYPQLLFPLPLVLTYSVISPLILLIGCFYYGLAYMVYRHQFLYKYQTVFEKGGDPYWRQTSMFMVFVVLTFQIMTALQFSVQNATLQASMIFPLICGTIYLSRLMYRTYKTRLLYIPLSKRADLSGLSTVYQYTGADEMRPLQQKSQKYTQLFNPFSQLLLISKFLARQKNLLGIILLEAHKDEVVVQSMGDASAGPSAPHVPWMMGQGPNVGANGEPLTSSAYLVTESRRKESLVTGLSSSVEALNTTITLDTSFKPMSSEDPTRIIAGLTDIHGATNVLHTSQVMEDIDSPEAHDEEAQFDTIDLEWYLSNPYRNPTLFKKLQHLFLPRSFYKLVKLVKQENSL